MEMQESFSTPVESKITQLQNESEHQVDEPEAVVEVVDPTKLCYELQQGYRIFRELLSDPYRSITYPFLEPVDAEALGLWDYHERIKEPMCFTTIGSKFNNYEYTSITEVISDIRLILENCYRYNGAEHWVSKQGQKLEKVLEQKCALLNRSLREKCTLSATMAVRGNCSVEATLESSSGRRRSGRNSYIGSLKGENSSLVTQIKIREECEERERRKQREKEKKEANEALLQELTEWEKKHLTSDHLKQLHSMWEIPSVGSLLYLVKDILNLQDICFSEFELSFLYPKHSSLLARIFTALLLTPHQRKSLSSKPAMKFKVWQAKLRGRLALWHKYLEKDGPEVAALQFGLDTRYFEIVGEKNPLEETCYDELTCHKRVWILKSVVESCLYLDADFRGQLNTVTASDQRELQLGVDAENWSYLYFPMFCSTDIRIYRQAPLPIPSLKKTKKVVNEVIKSESPAKSAATFSPAQRHLRLRKGAPSPKLSCEDNSCDGIINDNFGTACYDVETLKQLCDKFDEPPPQQRKRGRKSKPPPPRKRCEIDLHDTFKAMWEELEKYESKFTKFLTKAKIKLMKESQEHEVQQEKTDKTVKDENEKEGGEEDYGSEESSDEKDDAEEEEPSEEESVNENSTDDVAKPPAWKRKLGLALADAGNSPGSPALSEESVECILSQKTKKQRNNGSQSEDKAGEITVSVSAAEAVQALANFSTSSSANTDVADVLTSDANEKPVEDIATGGMSLRAKRRATAQRTLVVPTMASPKSNSKKLQTMPSGDSSLKRSSSYGPAAGPTSSKDRIPAVLIQHGIVKIKPQKLKYQAVANEPVPRNLQAPPVSTTKAQAGFTLSESRHSVEEQVVKANCSTRISSANKSSCSAIVSTSSSTVTEPSQVVKKTVLVYTQPLDFKTPVLSQSKTSSITGTVPPRLVDAKDTPLKPDMFVVGQSTALKQLLTPPTASTENLSSSVFQSAAQKVVLPASTHRSNTATLAVLPKTTAPNIMKKPAILKRATTKSGQFIRGSQSCSASTLSVTAAMAAALTVSSATKMTSNLAMAPSISRLPQTAVRLLSPENVVSPSLLSASMKQPRDGKSRDVTVVNTIPVAHAQVPTTNELLKAGAKSVQQLIVPKVNPSNLSSTSTLAPRALGPHSVQPTVQFPSPEIIVASKSVMHHCTSNIPQAEQPAVTVPSVPGVVAASIPSSVTTIQATVPSPIQPTVTVSSVPKVVVASIPSPVTTIQATVPLSIQPAVTVTSVLGVVAASIPSSVTTIQATAPSPIQPAVTVASVPRVVVASIPSSVTTFQDTESSPIQPAVQVSSVSKVVATSAQLAKGTQLHTPSTVPLAFVAPTVVTQFQHHIPMSSSLTNVSVPSSFLPNLAQQDSSQKLLDNSTLGVSSPATSSQLIHSKQYAFAKLVTTSVNNSFSIPVTLPTPTSSTAPTFNLQLESTKCVTPSVSCPVTSVSFKQTKISATSPSPISETLVINPELTKRESSSLGSLNKTEVSLVNFVKSSAATSEKLTIPTSSEDSVCTEKPVSLFVNSPSVNASTTDSKGQLETCTHEGQNDSLNVPVKRSLNCINGDLNHISKKQKKTDNENTNGTISNVLENSVGKKIFASCAGAGAVKDTINSEPNADNLPNALGLYNTLGSV